MSDAAGRIGLEVFGAVTASISHEIKNRMAVINEHAGLMDDHIRMAGDGLELKIESIQRSVDKIRQQVSMANDIIAHVNRFAHSIDKASQPVTLHDAAILVAALFQRTASAREISIRVQEYDSPGTVETSFFHVLALIWLCLKDTMVIAAEKSAVDITCEREENESRIIISLEPDTGKDIEAVVSEGANQVAAEIGARVDAETGNDRIILGFS